MEQINGRKPRYHKLEPLKCKGLGNKKCRRIARFPSGRCGQCEDAAHSNQFRVLDSYLPGPRTRKRS